MNWLDIAILAIVFLSALISLVRGFVREVLSLVVWVGAFWVGIRFSQELSVHFIGYVDSPTLRLGLAFGLLFVAVLIVGAVINYVAGLLVGKTGLTGTDRLIGVIFGVARGFVVVAILVLAAGLTAFPREPIWQESVLIAHIHPVVCDVGVEEWLDGMMVYSPLAGENGNEGQHAPEYWSDFCDPRESGAVEPTTGDS